MSPSSESMSLGDSVSKEWIKGLKDGAQVEQYVALSTTDKMEAIFLKKQKAPDANRSAALPEVRRRMMERARKWKAWHPESYESMQAGEMFAPFEQERAEGPDENEISLPEVPPQLHALIERELGDAKIVDIHLGAKNGKIVYKVDAEFSDGRQIQNNLQIEGEGVSQKKSKIKELDQ